MAENSKIAWTDHTFNPWVGCEKVSAACDNCYAEAWAKRFGRPELWNGQRRRTTEANWQKPRAWNSYAAAYGERRQRVFCSSLADVFDNQAPDQWRVDLWVLIEQTPNLDWLLLTKRPQNISKMLPANWGNGWPNVCLGITVENQQEADRRVPVLLDIPAAVRFLSCEPLLGPINLLGGGTLPNGRPRGGYYWLTERPCPVCEMEDGLRKKRGQYHHSINCGWRKDQGDARGGIDWVIAGGESGPGARPMDLDWARDLHKQCASVGVPFFMKQLGGERDKRDRMEDFPEDLRVRDFPVATTIPRPRCPA